jgi:hypothetical protein
MSRNFIKQLKALNEGSVNPRNEWVKTNRDLLLSQIKNTIVVSEEATTKKSIFNLNSFTFIYTLVRPVAVLVIIGVLGTTGWIASSKAAFEALPGDLFYPAKRVMEKTQVALASVTGDKNKEVQLHVEFAHRRADEAQKVVNDPAKKKLAEQTVNNLKNELNSANKQLTTLKAESPNVLSTQTAKDLQQYTHEIKQTLQEVKLTLQASTTTEDKNLSEQLALVKDLTKDTDINTVEAIIASHINGNTTFSKEELNVLIDKALQEAVGELGTSRQGVGDMKIILDNVKTELTKKFASKLSKEYTISPSTTKLLVEQISDAANQTSQAIAKNQSVSLEVNEKIKKVNEALEKNDLSGVVAKMKEVNLATKEAEKISNTALQKAQTILPISLVSTSGEGVQTTSSSSLLIIITPTSSLIATPTTTSNFTSSGIIKVITSTTPPVIINVSTSGSNTLKTK